MDKKQFTEMVTRHDRFSPQDRGWLRAMVDKYPHSSLMATLALLADHVYHFDTPTERRAVVLSMCDSRQLDSMISNAATRTEEQNTDILNEINTFQEVSFKTAPKSVILSNFLKVGPSEEMKNAQSEPVAVEQNDKKSIQADSSLGTETLAVILEKQGKYDKALAIYRNLLAQNPEKSSNFAPRIERLETLINSK